MYPPEQNHVTKVLAQCLTGVVRTDPEAIAAASIDFGGVVCRKPQAVVWPTHTDDVVTIVRYARERGWTVSARGAGHSQGGQGLNQAGLVIDTRNLSQIEEVNEDEGWVIAGAGGLWSALVRAMLARKLLPPVLTDNLAVTIGGTLSVGGIGPASFRRGLQAGHCLGLEVALGSGEVVWLTPEREPELFQHVLCGLGQFGLITKAKLRLRPLRPYTQSVYLSYQSLEPFLNDALILLRRNSVDLLEGGGRPQLDRASPARGRKQRYILEVTAEVDELTDEAISGLSQGLNGEARRQEINRPTSEYIFRLEQRFAGYQRPAEKDRAHPWVEHFLPFSAITEYLDAVRLNFPSTSLLLWPMLTEQLRLPMFAAPESPEVVLVGILASIPPVELGATLPFLQQASELGIALGGKRYLSGWLDFNREQWRQHYGPARWERIMQLKQRCDPDRIFQSWSFL